MKRRVSEPRAPSAPGRLTAPAAVATVVYPTSSDPKAHHVTDRTPNLNIIIFFLLSANRRVKPHSTILINEPYYLCYRYSGIGCLVRKTRAAAAAAGVVDNSGALFVDYSSSYTRSIEKVPGFYF